MTQHDIHLSNPNTAIITGTCPHDCPDPCSWLVTARNRASPHGSGLRPYFHSQISKYPTNAPPIFARMSIQVSNPLESN